MSTVTIARIRAKAVLPAVLVASLPEHAFVEKLAPAVVAGQFSEQQPIRSSAVEETEAFQTRAYTKPATEWTRQMARRFRELAKKEAFGSITADELTELERLTQDRRNLEYPRPAEEVLWEYNQRQVNANLVHALKEYVQFHSFPHRTRSSAA